MSIPNQRTGRSRGRDAVPGGVEQGGERLGLARRSSPPRACRRARRRARSRRPAAPRYRSAGGGSASRRSRRRSAPEPRLGSETISEATVTWAKMSRSASRSPVEWWNRIYSSVSSSRSLVARAGRDDRHRHPLDERAGGAVERAERADAILDAGGADALEAGIAVGRIAAAELVDVGHAHDPLGRVERVEEVGGIVARARRRHGRGRIASAGRPDTGRRCRRAAAIS